jgi:hypothetical protein
MYIYKNRHFLLIPKVSALAHANACYLEKDSFGSMIYKLLIRKVFTSSVVLLLAVRKEQIKSNSTFVFLNHFSSSDRASLQADLTEEKPRIPSIFPQNLFFNFLPTRSSFFKVFLAAAGVTP